jgi:lipopolysaccharide/colanic/teichoic acid biosynthesis glycosyltransferase
MIRILDIILTTLGIIILMPFFIIIGILIKLNSKGPFLYKQERVGWKGIDFQVYKFRTMYVDSDKLGLLTVGGRDPRITKVGYYLRKLKLDELPQLFNVLFGNMSLVGPRPEVRKYVELYTFEQKKILLIKPGITDWASIVYRDENIILEKSLNPEKDYIQIILPDKIKYNLIFLNNYKVLEYLKILIFTFIKIINPKFTFINFRQLFT